MVSITKEHSSTIYQRVVKIYQMAAFVFQVDIIKENFKITPIVPIDFLLIFHYFASTVHTIITWNDKNEVLRSLCLEGLNIQLFVKAVTILYYRNQLYDLSEEILVLHNKAKGIYQDVMYNWAWRLELITKVQFVLYVFSGVAFCLYPFYGYFVLNEKTLIYNLLLPFDPTTKNGYAMTIAVQIFLSYGTTIIIFAVDLLFLLMIFSGAAYISVFECDCKMLSLALEKYRSDAMLKKSKENDKSKSNDTVNELLLTAIKRSQDIYEVCTIFEKGCLIQVYSCAATILLCVFVAKTSDWFVVYLIAVSAVYQLTVYCIVGTLIEYKSEEVVKSVYNIPWYDLTTKEQMMLKLLLQYVQNTITITVLGERKLNVQTGCDVFNTIYSTFVMMEQFY